MNKEESTEEFANKRRSFGKPLITELSLRNTAIMLALSCFISAAVCVNKITPVNLESILRHKTSPVLGSVILPLVQTTTNSIDYDLPLRTRAAAGWIIFLSLVVLLYQIFAVVQQFLYIPPLYMKIPIRKSFWYLFPLIDVVVKIICLVGYIPVVIATAVYTYQWIEMLVKIFQSLESSSNSSSPNNSYDKNSSEFQALLFKEYLLNILIPIIVTFTFVLGSTVRFIIMIVFIFLAKFKFKWPNYFVPADP